MRTCIIYKPDGINKIGPLVLSGSRFIKINAGRMVKKAARASWKYS